MQVCTVHTYNLFRETYLHYNGKPKRHARFRNYLHWNLAPFALILQAFDKVPTHVLYNALRSCDISLTKFHPITRMSNS